MSIKGIIITGVVLSCTFIAQAQDTTKKRSIEITSAFKPVLREAAKVNFNASAPHTDTSRPQLRYDLPAEKLMFVYQPGELKPLAFEPDSVNAWTLSNYIKVGFGNVHQPFVKAGFSFGDGENTFFNIFADHFTSKGDLENQKHSHSRIAANATYKTANNLEWNGAIGVTNNDYFLYGAPDTLPYTKEDLKQRFQSMDVKLGLRNIVPTNFGLNFDPTLQFNVFSDNHSRKGSEANTILSVPVTKTLGKTTDFKLGVTADLTNYKRQELDAINNNIFLIQPALQFKTPNFYLHAGITPSWDNGTFNMMPNLMADITTSDQRLTLQLGWIGYYDKGSYQRFSTINPWIAQPDSLKNDRVNEIYAGVKGSLADHFSYSAKIGLQKHHNIALFVNNTVDQKDFIALYEPELTVLNSHAEAQYTVGEKFSAKASVDIRSFTKQKKELQPWGLLPLELAASLRWQVMKDLYVSSGVWAFDGSKYMGLGGESYKGETGFDLNAGVEFKIVKNLSLWVQFNNILNNNYERWHRYEVFGFNVLGGVVYSFNQR